MHARRCVLEVFRIPSGYPGQPELLKADVAWLLDGNFCKGAANPKVLIICICLTHELLIDSPTEEDLRQDIALCKRRHLRRHTLSMVPQREVRGG